MRCAPDARGRRGQGVEPFWLDLQPTARAGAVRAFVETKQSGIDFGERASRLLKKPGDLLTLPGDGVAFGVVFVVGGHVTSGLDDAIETLREALGAAVGRSSKSGQSGAGIVRLDGDHPRVAVDDELAQWSAIRRNRNAGEVCVIEDGQHLRLGSRQRSTRLCDEPLINFQSSLSQLVPH